MRRLGVGVMSALLVFGSVAAPFGVRADDDAGEDHVQSAVKPSGSDPDRQAAREKICTDIVQLNLRWLSFAALKPNKRKTVIKQVAEHLRDEAWRPVDVKKPQGAHKMTASWSKSEIGNVINNALDTNTVFGQKKSVIFVMPNGWNGQGLSSNDVIMNKIRINCNDILNRNGFRIAPAALDKQKAEKAASAAGASPTIEHMGAYAEAFGADWTIFIKGQIKYFQWPNPRDNVIGDLRTQDCSAQVIDRAHGENLVEFSLDSSDEISDEQDATPNRLHQPFIPDLGSKEKVCEQYAACIGRMISYAIMKRLYERWYKDQPDDPAGGSSSSGGGASKCTCGQDLTPNATECPACGAKVTKSSTPPPTPGKRVPRHPDDDYVLQINGFQETEVGEIVNKLQEKDGDGFGNWKQGNEMAGKVTVYEFTFVGDLLIKRVRDALAEIGYDTKCRVSKSGQNIVIKKGQN